METLRATVATLQDKWFIRIEADGEVVSIPMSDDKPNEVKSAFNKIVNLIKIRQFQIKLEEVGDDLFSQVANEYIGQLNREIQEVYGEMKRLGLLLTAVV